ncbi:hypothetical protein [Asinibacterium sp. OR53]|uniref:hypothetical protein n=1 Tax=Asinibacterium sp. OR53 TaxID=925409 RepID=UPI0004ADCF83|nr:hypothetical protein [Asinibacterium sp. OR53]
MKKYLLGVYCLFHCGLTFAQNTFPSSGNVGIGTLSPVSQLTINGGDLQVESGQGRFKGWYHAGTGLGTEIGVSSGSGYVITFDRTGQAYASTSIQSNNALFTVSNNNSFLFTGGNVGVGTLAPVSRLSVDGGDLQVESGQGRFKGWYHVGTGLGTEIGVSSGSGYVITFDRTSQTYASTSIQSNNALFTVSSNNSFFFSGGNVGIGTTAPTEMLSVKGNVKAQKMIVTQTGWSDYVFDPSYQLKPLSQVEVFIKENKRLPEVPSAKEVEEKGISVGDNQALLLKKIEELTLYMIEMKKESKKQQEEIEMLKGKLNINKNKQENK